MMFRNKKKIIFLAVVLILSCVLYANVVHAQGELFRGVQECRKRGDCTPDDALQLIVNVVNILMRIIGVAALIMFCIGGIHWLTAGGRQAQVKRGKDIIIGATMGLFFVFFSWFIVRAIQDIFQLEPEYRVISWVEDCDEVEVGGEVLTPVPDGTPCGEGESMVCKAGRCVNKCIAYYGDKGYECDTISCDNCETDECTEEELDECASGKGCIRYLCPGGNLEMCCKK